MSDNSYNSNGFAWTTFGRFTPEGTAAVISWPIVQTEVKGFEPLVQRMLYVLRRFFCTGVFTAVSLSSWYPAFYRWQPNSY